MPALPEVARVRGEVGHAEIGHQAHAHPARDATSDGGIAVEVSVDLDRETPSGDKVVHTAELIGGGAVDGVRDRGHVIGDDDLHEEATDDEVEALGEVIAIDRTWLLQLRKETGRALDGSGDELWEVGDEEGEIDEVPRGLGLASVDVDRVRHRLEGVKRDANGEDDIQRRRGEAEADGIEKGGGVLDEEVEVFKEAEDTEVRDHRDGDPAFPESVGICIGDLLADEEIDDSREKDEPEKAPVPSSVEEVARENEYHVLPTMGEDAQQPEDNDEEAPEDVGVKGH